jgi:YVTN family beta-propeller protein
MGSDQTGAPFDGSSRTIEKMNTTKYRMILLGGTLLFFGLEGKVNGASQGRAFASDPVNSTISIISLDTLKVVDTIPTRGEPDALVLTPDGSRLYVANRATNNVSVIDTFSHSVIRTIPVGNEPAALTISRDGRHVYVANLESSNISVIATDSNTVEATVPTPSTPSAVAYHPIRDELWVGFGMLGTVLEVLSASDFSVLASRNSPDRLYGGAGIQFTPNGSEAFGTETCGCCGRFHLISGVYSNGIIEIIRQDLFQGGNHAVGAVVQPSSGNAYFAQQGQCFTPPAPRISELGGANRTLPLPQIPNGLGITPDGNRLLILQPSNVQVVDVETFVTVTNINASSSFTHIVMDSISTEPTLTVEVAQLQLCWRSVLNNQYQMEQRSSLTTNSWQPLGGIVIGNGSTNCVFDSILGKPQRFYRVRRIE